MEYNGILKTENWEYKGCFTLVAKTIVIIITALILFLFAVDVIKQVNKGIESFFNSFSDLFTSPFPYIDPNILILIYLVGYAITWWKKQWGTVIIIVVSIYGIIISEAGDVQFCFILTLLAGFLVGFLYFVDWYDKKNRKNNA